MSNEIKTAAENLIKEIDHLARCQRNISMESFKDSHVVSSLRNAVNRKINYQVIVGNIGNVYDGEDKAEALENFREYYAQSKEKYGRAAGEPVFLMVDGEPIDSVDQVNVILG